MERRARVRGLPIGGARAGLGGEGGRGGRRILLRTRLIEQGTMAHGGAEGRLRVDQSYHGLKQRSPGPCIR